jgi:two-component system sensor histidine kinase KdpD
LEEIRAELAPTVHRQQVALRLSCSPHLPDLPLDGALVHHVLVSLLRESLRRTAAAGTVALDVSATLEEATFTVSDDGPPLNPDLGSRLLPGSVEPGIPSWRAAVGIGLFASRQVVQAMGGHLWIPDVQDRGERPRYRFILPI